MSLDYPVLEVLPSLRQSLANHPIVILQAPPGAGKSTMLPWMLLDEPWLAQKRIIMLEPRRLAAKSVAMRMAHMMKEDIGETIGYRVRFEQVRSERTRCDVVTEGILTRMIQGNNSLEDTGLIIFDEFHERSLHADLALALCCQIQQILRPDLKILIMSATLDAENISAVLNNAPVVSSAGRQHPVTIHYAPQEKNVALPSAVSRTILKAYRDQPGDLLVFLPGTGDIHRTLELLTNEGLGMNVFPLYGDLPFARQQEAIVPNRNGIRKIVLSTSIAETSLTIEGITTVIDSGYSRIPKFDPRSGLTTLETVRVTKDAADQRAGRAGRLGPGVCYRMWGENTHHNLQPARSPEILEADLAPMLLELYNWGTKEISDLVWITAPPAGAISQAKDLLTQLNALKDELITERGKRMLRLPTHPRLAHMLLADSHHVALATDIASLLEERDPLEKNAGADLSLRVEYLRRWRNGQQVPADKNALEKIERLAATWRKILKCSVDNTVPGESQVGALVAEAYPERIARQIERHSPRYKLTNARVVRLMDHDPLLREPWLAIAQVDSGAGEGKIFLAAPIHEDDLVHRAIEKEIMAWNYDKGMLVASYEKRIGNVVLASRPMTAINETQRLDILCNVIRKEGLSLLNWTDHQKSWQSRVMSLHGWRKDEGWPDVSTENLLATAMDWLGPYITNIYRRQDFQKLDLGNILTAILPWAIGNKLDILAPPRLVVPSGSMISLTYKPDGSPPVMEVRLQEVFGLLETPTVNDGRTKVLLHLLSPGHKPVQVTQDLRSFWQTAYHEVRKEMRMRYPRHHWPEDPWTAEAMRGAKRRKQ
ncbi:MAG: ATP-dependent helicase HrpB [Chryseolinea sp.]